MAKTRISRRGSLIKEDLLKVGRGALVAGVGAALFYALEALPNVNFGKAWTPIIVMALSIFSNFVRKYWQENVYK